MSRIGYLFMKEGRIRGSDMMKMPLIGQLGSNRFVSRVEGLCASWVLRIIGWNVFNWRVDGYKAERRNERVTQSLVRVEANERRLCPMRLVDVSSGIHQASISPDILPHLCTDSEV